ncbi:hypothetical protein N7488_006196 [Penicillium malachiteum]|nr:hypothetical protein N7488_006196 [Penicillium malachiteum]
MLSPTLARGKKISTSNVRDNLLFFSALYQFAVLSPFPFLSLISQVGFIRCPRYIDYREPWRTRSARLWNQLPVSGSWAIQSRLPAQTPYLPFDFKRQTYPHGKIVHQKSNRKADFATAIAISTAFTFSKLESTYININHETNPERLHPSPL